MKTRTIVAGLAVAGSTLIAATPAHAHGCSLNASPPTAGGNTVQGKATFSCTGHTSAKLNLYVCLDWQDANGSLQSICEYGWAWVSKVSKTVTVHVGCPVVPTTYSTWAQGWLYHTDTGRTDHVNTDSSPGVLVDPVTCAVLPRLT